MLRIDNGKQSFGKNRQSSHKIITFKMYIYLSCWTCTLWLLKLCLIFCFKRSKAFYLLHKIKRVENTSINTSNKLLFINSRDLIKFFSNIIVHLYKHRLTHMHLYWHFLLVTVHWCRPSSHTPTSMPMLDLLRIQHIGCKRTCLVSLHSWLAGGYVGFKWHFDSLKFCRK